MSRVCAYLTNYMASHITAERISYLEIYILPAQWTASNLLCSERAESNAKQIELQSEVCALVFIILQDVRRKV
jgi:hypothetical protein